MRIQIIQVSYDSGHRSIRMGCGPGHFVRNGVCETLGGNGHEVYLEVVNATGTFEAEIATAFELHKLVADRVRGTVEQGCFPLVLSGNCNPSVGTITGLVPQELGIIWFDGHADFNTPETTTNGFLDGMGLAIGTGGCWKKMEQRHAGSLGNALDALHTRVRKVYVHLDLDVLDPEIAPANELRPEELEEGLRTIQDRFTLAGVGVASYDPEYDREGRMLRTGVRLMEALTDYSTDKKWSR